MAASFREKQLKIDDIFVELEKPIKHLVELPERIIVVFQYGAYEVDDSERDRNVIAVDHRGTMQWRIERSMSSTPAEPGRTAPFVGVDIRQRNEEEALVAYDIMGSCYDLDSETGKLSNPVLTK